MNPAVTLYQVPGTEFLVMDRTVPALEELSTSWERQDRITRVKR